MKTIGIDASLSSTGIVAWDGSACISDVISIGCLPAVTEMEARISRAGSIASRVGNFVGWHKPDCVCIEGYSYGSPNRSHGLGELGFAIRCVVGLKTPMSPLLFHDGPFFIEVPPGSLKKFVTGKGNANKSQVVSKLSSLYPNEVESFRCDDQFDAFGLALIGMCLVNQSEPTNQHQRDVIAQLRKGINCLPK